jgi:aspartate aminotransferase
MIHNSEDMSLYLLEIAHVATVGGKSFGDANCLRISFAASEEMINKAFDRIKAALEQLN